MNFVPGASVSFGAMSAVNVAVVSGTTITCETPTNSVGTFDVIVFNPDGSSATLPGGYDYQ